MSSYKFKNVYIKDSYTVAGPLESNGKLKKYNEFLDNYYYGEKTFEKAEIKMQQSVLKNLLINNSILDTDVNLVIGGDLINQISVTNYTVRDFKIPFIGVYSACSTFTESLVLASIFIDNYKHKNVIVLTSSHNLTAERQFRFPVEYGSPRPKTSTFTSTGSVGALLTSVKSNIKIEGATIGKVIDKGITDVNHMGAVMAPAASDTLNKHLNDFNRDINYYDLILTGDLGCIGLEILKKYTKEVYNVNLKKIKDSGCELYLDSQDTYAGGSGPVCLPLILFNNIITNKKYKKILILGTGSLHSPALVNQHNTIPSISHAISLEVI